MEFTAGQIAEALEGTVHGNPDARISRPAKIEDAAEGDLSFLANPKYEKYFFGSEASVIIVSNDQVLPENSKTTYIRVSDPYLAFSTMLDEYAKLLDEKKGEESPVYKGHDLQLGKNLYLGAFSYLGGRVKIADDVKIYPHVYIGDGVEIGEGTVLYSGVKIYGGCKVGKNCILHAGAVLGSDGFGFAPDENGEYKKIPQLGNVILGDRVEIGANTVVDRATIGSTRIANGVKLDNLVQVAHNVEIGENTVIAAQAGISGSTHVGKNCMIGGQAGMVGHIYIADGTKLNAQSGLSKSVKKPGTALSGSPAVGFREHYKATAMMYQFPQVIDRICKLEKKIEEVKK